MQIITYLCSANKKKINVMKRFFEILVKDLDFGKVLVEETVSSQKDLFCILNKYKGRPYAIRVSLYLGNYHPGDEPDDYCTLNGSMNKTVKDLRLCLSRIL